jgi:uncharacterized RDD family membrane protein YckC/Tfp pilus assembly major pilin PilA
MSLREPRVIVPLHAGFWRRVAANVLDGLVLLVPNVVVVMLMGDNAAAMLLQLAVMILYFALMHASAGQGTVGKRAFGVKVTGLDGERIGFLRALLRVPAFWVSSLIFGIGLLMAAFTARKQALHDMLCGTLVVNRAATPEEVRAGGDAMPVTGGVWATIMLVGIVPVIGILAAIAIPAYHDYTIRAKVAEVMSATTPLRRQVEQAYGAGQPLPTGTQQIGTPFASGAEITPQGHVVVTLAEQTVRGGGRIRHTPVITQGVVRWKCSGEAVQPRYLPAMCRE